MTDYRSGFTLQALADIVHGEQRHKETAVQAAEMWASAENFIDEAAGSLKQKMADLEHVWRDDAGRLFRQDQLERNARELEACRDRIRKQNLPAILGEIPGYIDTAARMVDAVVTAYNNDHRISLGLDPEKEYVEMAGTVLNALAQRYTWARWSMDVGEMSWHGPRAALPGTAQGVPTTGPGGVGPAGASSAGAPDPAQTPDPAQAPGEQQPETASPQDLAKALMEQGPEALNALSQAMQSLDQLLGGTGDVPDPVTLPDSVGEFDPAALAGMSPAELANYLNGLGGGTSGLPSLAGGGGVGDAGSSMTASSPVASAPSAGASAAALPVASTATGVVGSGGMPPMYPPNAAGARSEGGGVRPGAAETAGTGRPRERKPGGTPGVSLRGRAGRTGPAKPSTPQRRWDTENNTVQLLDEELWQVNQVESHGGEPRYRAGH